jgi:hypothetical protein
LDAAPADAESEQVATERQRSAAQSAASRGYADSHEGRGNAVSDLAKRRLIDVAVTAVFVFTLTLLTEKWWMPPALFAHAMWNFYDGMTRRDLQA